ncbi:hypothetical protein [Novosphingobium sp. NDB2Meth1]|uniref:hypothetical protein n=1 Tax=Novosphingobium sp. NDB2Meth1 TaxID=1892847 RepID=UPI0009FB9360|nr:hypothetical protein [Novosphingobium sp. NDB2Meth1]
MTGVPPPPRKTLLEWIETDDGDTSGDARPVCSASQQALHANLAGAPEGSGHEPLTPPAGLFLAPLG